MVPAELIALSAIIGFSLIALCALFLLAFHLLSNQNKTQLVPSTQNQSALSTQNENRLQLVDKLSVGLGKDLVLVQLWNRSFLLGANFNNLFFIGEMTPPTQLKTDETVSEIALEEENYRLVEIKKDKEQVRDQDWQIGDQNNDLRRFKLGQTTFMNSWVRRSAQNNNPPISEAQMLEPEEMQAPNKQEVSS